ncbi:1,3-beta-glucanosyltransferase gas1 [Chytridiales sp. JEL 0842]|nr:1,3-beta-glucanosyltransferase gas1 [Chytridiales sp. JEL 0842]
MAYFTLCVIASLFALPSYPQTAFVHAGPIVIKGNQFFDSSTGKQFFAKGIAYQPGRDSGIIYDPITNGKQSAWKRDLEIMHDLGMNVIRVYDVDPFAPHDLFMNALQEKGMYLLLDLGQVTNSINRNDPSYTLQLLDQFKATMDAFSKFENTFAYFAGNEVVNSLNTSIAAPFVKALIRDTKAHMRKSKRYIPIGYSSSDDDTIRLEIMDYMLCGPEEEQVDFYGLNIYSWCGDSSFSMSKYDTRTEEIKKFGVPFLISEYGCNTVSPRPFTEVKAIYGPQMTPWWSGGIMYEYSQEDNNYGIVELRQGNAELLPDYQHLKDALSEVNPKQQDMNAYTPPPRHTAQCPAVSATGWQGSPKIPSPPSDCICSTMKASLHCRTTLSADRPSSLTKIGEQITIACGLLNPDNKACKDIEAGSGLTGTYGKFSACGDAEKLSWVYNAYFQQENRRADACDFQQTAKVSVPSVRLSDLSKCEGYSDSSNGGGAGGSDGSSGGSGSGSGSGGGAGSNDAMASAAGISLLQILTAPTTPIIEPAIKLPPKDSKPVSRRGHTADGGESSAASSRAASPSRVAAASASVSRANTAKRLDASKKSIKAIQQPKKTKTINRDIPIAFNLSRVISSQLLLELEAARHDQRQKRTPSFTGSNVISNEDLQNSEDNFEAAYIREMKSHQDFLYVPPQSVSLALGMPRQANTFIKKSKQSPKKRNLPKPRLAGGSIPIILEPLKENLLMPETTQSITPVRASVSVRDAKPKSAPQKEPTAPTGQSANPCTPTTQNNNSGTSAEGSNANTAGGMYINQTSATAIPLPGRRASLMTPPTPLRPFSADMKTLKDADEKEQDASSPETPPDSSSNTESSPTDAKSLSEPSTAQDTPPTPTTPLTPLSKRKQSLRFANGRGHRPSVIDTSMYSKDDKTERSYCLSDFIIVRKVGSSRLSKTFQVTLNNIPAVRRRPYAMRRIFKKKLTSETLVEAVKRERFIHASMTSRFCTQLLATFTDSSSLYVVLEWAPGSLDRLLGFQRSFTEDQARFYAAEITSGLDYIHARNIVHRAIEPSNIFLEASGHVKIADFSAAAILGPDGTVRDTSTVKPCRYTAPEILLGSKHGKVADWFSLGTMLYEMLTGVIPFGMGTVLDTVAAALAAVRKKGKDDGSFQDDDELTKEPEKSPRNSATKKGGKSTNVAAVYSAILEGAFFGKTTSLLPFQYRNIAEVYNISRPAEDIVRRLMEVDYTHRLTSLRGSMDVKAHPWFRPLNVAWRDIEDAKLVPPFVPGMEEDEVRIAAVMGAINNGYITKLAYLESDEKDEDDVRVKFGVRKAAGEGEEGGDGVAAAEQEPFVLQDKHVANCSSLILSRHSNAESAKPVDSATTSNTTSPSSSKSLTKVKVYSYPNYQLYLYDYIVHHLCDHQLWRCPASLQISFFEKYLTSNHLDVGVGSGYFWRHCKLPTTSPINPSVEKAAETMMRITLMDLSPGPLLHTSNILLSRLPPQSTFPWDLRLLHADALSEPLSVSTLPNLPLESKFKSISVFYLLHCLPGSMRTKAALLFNNLKGVLHPEDGVIYGTTILGSIIKKGECGKDAATLCELYHKAGVFDNFGDDAQGILDAARDVGMKGEVLDVVGAVALFAVRFK